MIPPLAERRIPSRFERITAFAAVGAAVLGFLGGVVLRQGWAAAAQAAGFLGVSAAGAGKLIIFASLYPNCRLSAWTLALGATVAEIGMAALLLSHLDLLFRVPRLGPRLLAIRAQSAGYLQGHRWLRRLAGIGVGIYTALPFSGTGPLGSTFFGEMAALPPRTILLGIAGGSAVSSALMALGAVALERRMEAMMRHPAMTVAGVLLTLGLLTALAWAWRRTSRAGVG